MTSLHVLVGSGGVGKTTLAAGYALALARSGRRVALLGADPSRRLQDALGVTLGDCEVAIEAGLCAAIVEPHHLIARWVAETCSDDARARLATNPFFAALGDRLATAVDILASVRVAEWIERDPALTDVVIDTAPGLAALDFVRAPRLLAALVEGRMLRWLRAVAHHRSAGVGARAIRAFAGLAGARLVADLAELFALAQPPLARMLARVVVARALLASPRSQLLLVTSPRDPAACGAALLAAALRAEGLAPAAVIVNRTWPAELARELATARDGAFLSYARAQLAAQDRVTAAARALGPIVTLPSLAAFDRDALAALASPLVARSPS